MTFLEGKSGSMSINIMNCGTFFRRKSDEILYRPQIGLLYDDGSIAIHYLDVSRDLYVEAKDKKTPKFDGTDTSEVLAGFNGLGKDSLNFREALEHRLHQVPPDESVTRMVLESLPKSD